MRFIRHVVAVGIALAVITGPSVPSVVAAPGPRLTLSARPTPALPAEKVAFTGRLVPAQAGRTVVLQRRTARGWLAAGRATTNARGAYTVVAPVPRVIAVHQYRVLLPRTARRPALASAARPLTVVRPRLLLDSALRDKGVFGRVTFRGRLAPARRVPLALQRLTVAGWQELAAGRSDSKGAYALAAILPQEGSYRVVASVPAGLLGSRLVQQSLPLRTAWLSDLPYSSGHFPATTSPVAVNGIVEPRSLRIPAPGVDRLYTWTEHQLAQPWSTFTAEIGFEDGSAPGTTALVEVLADGRLIWSSMVRAGVLIPVSLDVELVRRLRIEVSSWNELGLGNAGSQAAVVGGLLSSASSGQTPPTGQVVGFLEDQNLVHQGGRCGACQRFCVRA